MGSYLNVTKSGPVWRIALDRPERRNAHDLAMLKEIAEVFARVEDDPDCRCAILTGSGDIFCAGQDMRFTRDADAQAVDAYGRCNLDVLRRIQRNAKPVIAAVNGPAIGGGCYLATACDLVVAVDSAYFQMPEIRAGNQAGGAFLFTIGRARSLELALLGQRLPARKALDWGLINRVVPASELDAAVAETAQALVALPPLALRYTKSACNLLLDAAGYSNHFEAGGPVQRYLGLTPDGREAKRAFLERREPHFTGGHPKLAE